MRLKGERWDFMIGNNLIIIENAWSVFGYSQERVRLNDEAIFDRSGWFWIVVSATILAEFEILEKAYAVTVGLSRDGNKYKIYSRIIDEDENVIEPDEAYTARWDNKVHKWPPTAQDWTVVGNTALEL